MNTNAIELLERLMQESRNATSGSRVKQDAPTLTPWLGRTENAPGHAHSAPGFWDGDNGQWSGKPCSYCHAWNQARHLVTAIRLGANIVESPSDFGLNA